MAASIIDSPTTFNMNNSPLPTIEAGNGIVSSIDCSAKIGPPAAIRPTSGIWRERSAITLESDSTTSSARPKEPSRRIKPASSRALS